MPAPLAAGSGAENYRCMPYRGRAIKTSRPVSNSYRLGVYKERLDVQRSCVSSCLSDPTKSFLVAYAISLASAAMPF